MKLKTTKKAIKNSYETIIKIGYCNAQNLLRYEEPFAYSSGVYGHACDYYDFNGICISTGYSPIGEHINSDLLENLESRACAISNYNYHTYEEKKELVHVLILELLINQQA